MKKKIIWILTVVNICIIIIWIMYLVKNQMYPRKYIKELFESNSNCRNYIITITYTDYINEDWSYQETITCKDDIYKRENRGENANDIIWHIEDKFILEASKEIVYNDGAGYIFTLTNLQGMDMYINNTDAKYRFVKLEKYNGKQCIVVEFEYMNQIYRFWIDKETGVILKQIEFNKYSEILKEYVYIVERNCVTDSDMILPNTNEYKVIDYRED